MKTYASKNVYNNLLAKTVVVITFIICLYTPSFFNHDFIMFYSN